MKIIAAAILVLLFAACEASNLEVRKGGSFSGSVSGKLPEKANLFAKKTGLSLAESQAANEDCMDAKVGLYAIDGNKEVMVSSVDSAPGGEYFFSKERLAARKSSPTEKLTIKARFCFGEMRERFVSGSSDQNLDLSTTALARWIRQSGKITNLSQADIKQLADSIPASEVPEDVQRIFSENDTIRALLQKKLGSSVETMESASPEIFRLTGPSQVAEGEPAYFTGDVLDWSAARLGFEWQVDGKILSTSRVLEYLPGMNDQGKHEVTLRVGKKDSVTGAIDEKATTKLSRTFEVDNKFIAEAPPFTAEVSKLSIAKKSLTIAAQIHTGENLERCQTFSKIALVKGMETPTEDQFTLVCKDSKTQAVVLELPWDGGKQIAISMWVRDRSGTVSLKPIVANLIVPIPGLTVQDVNPPTLSAEVVTSSLRPVWNWTSGGGGTGLFRFKLDNSDFSADSTETGSASFSPKVDLTEGSHTLFVQEKSLSESWSATASLAITIDRTPPGTPQLSAAQQIANTLRPTWTWISGGAGSGNYRYKLGDADLSTGTVSTITATFTPGVDLSEGSHTLYVQEKDSAGNWSALNSLAIVIDVTAPLAPTVSGIAQTNSLRPTWSWSSGGGSGSGNYRYKLDNTDLSTGATLSTSTSYTPSTDLSEGTHRLSVQERDAAGNWSNSGSFVLTIDATAPLSPTVSGSSMTNSLRPTWNWVSGGTGNGNYRYKLNDSNLTLSSTATTNTTYSPASDLTEGTFVLYVQEQDSAGNWSALGSHTVVIDATPPSAPEFSGTTLVSITRPTWTWSSGGAGSGNYRYKLDSSDFSVGAITTTATTFTPGVELSEGSHTLYVQEKDSVGNWSAANSLAIIIDVTAPLAPSFSGSAQTNSLRPTWSWTSGGGSGSGNYRFKFDSVDLSTGATLTTSTFYSPSTNLSEGEHRLYVQEKDTAGNWSNSGSFLITIDATAPIAPTVSGSSTTNSLRPTWNWVSGGTGNETYRYKLNNSNLNSGSTATTNTSYTPTTDLAEGTHILYVQEQDAAGNWSALGSHSVLIDATPPSAPELSGSTLVSTTRPTWSWSSGGAGSGNYRYKLNNSDFSTGATTTTATSYTPGVDFSEGSHVLYAQEKDSVGNWSASGSLAITIDLTAPTAPSVSGSAYSNSLQPTWTWVSGGGGSGNYRYKLGSADLSTGATLTTSTTFSPSTNLSEGANQLYVQERDAAGNWSNAGSLVVTIDATAPLAPTVSGSTITNSLRPSWNWVSGGTGNGNYRYKLNDSNLTSGSTATTNTSYSPTSDLTEGTFVLYVQEQDSAGNWSASGLLSIVVDNTSPPEPILSGTSLEITARPTWTWSSGGAGNGTYRYKLDSSDFSTGAITTTATTFSPGVDLSEGSHTLYVQEKDSAGNWSTSGSLAIAIDLSAPLSPTVSGSANTSSNRPTWTWTSRGGGNGTYRYKLDDTTMETGSTLTTATSFQPSTALTEGLHRLNVQERDAAGNWSEIGYQVTNLDFTPAASPVFTGVATSNSLKPTWTWTPGGGGGGNFRYKLNDSNLSTGYTSTTSATYTPASNLTEGTHILYVREDDNVGNWSVSGAFSIVIDTTPPNSPALSATTLTGARPTWNWASGGNGSGAYRYKLNNSDFSSGTTSTSSTSYTPGTDLAAGSHTLYVQESDTAGNWSSSGSLAITIDLTAPSAPTVQSVSPVSPANLNSIRILGTAEANSTINLYTNGLCTGTAAATGPASEFLTPGLLAFVSDNTSTTYWAKATDVAGNTSACSTVGITFIEDSTAPSTPTFSGSTPGSASANGTPLLYGSAEAGGTVSLFTNNTCANTAAATGTASAFVSPGNRVRGGFRPRLLTEPCLRVRTRLFIST
jgi:hypothetical protein